MNKKFIFIAVVAVLVVAAGAVVVASRWNRHTIVTKDYWPDAGQPVVHDINQPTSDKLTADENAIRAFMGVPNLALDYITSQKNPANFSVGKIETVPVKGTNESGAWKMEIPKEWERPVNIYQQTKYIDDRCEVYEFEVDARNSQVVEVHLKYAQEIEQMEASGTPVNIMDRCKSYPSMEVPLKTKDIIQTNALTYLSRLPNYDAIKDQLTYIPSSKNPINAPAANEWKWEDKSYKLPEGLSSDPWPYPTVRIIMTSGRKLLYYLNTTGLFQN